MTHNTTFSGHFALPNFGHPFMFADGLTSESGNGEKWGKAVVPEHDLENRLKGKSDNRQRSTSAPI